MRAKELCYKIEVIHYQQQANSARAQVMSAYARLEAAASETDEEGNPIGDVSGARAEVYAAQALLESAEVNLAEANQQLEIVGRRKLDAVHEIERYENVEEGNMSKLAELQKKRFGANANAFMADLAARMNSGEQARQQLLHSMGVSSPGKSYSAGGVSGSAGGVAGTGSSGVGDVAASNTYGFAPAMLSHRDRIKWDYSQRAYAIWNNSNLSTSEKATLLRTEREKGHLRMMLLKLFMAFPAGKLEATMIDPLELGETFAMFTKLGEEQSRIIDTKIWSQEKDISESINILRQKLETMTQAYGNDKVTRLKKEPVRVLAITDFPTGFTQNALRDLQAIVRKSASCGVCVFIWANSEEIAKLQASQQSIFNEIKQMLHVASATSNGALKLETAKYENVYLHLDPVSKAQDHAHAIINTLTKGIHNSPKKTERFVDMYDGIEDPNNWFGENTINEFSIPIGIKGASTIVKMIVGKTDGSTAHHALIAGQTGAGKSTLLHTIIMSTLLNYSPDEAQLYLVDFKEGVEFKTYSKLNLPSIRVVAIDCEREFGLNILKELQKEMKRRYDLFKREADREEISDYRKVTGKKIPKILVVFDEVQELFRGASDDSISKDCETILGELLTLGRAAGIHVILASQNFNLISSIKPTLFAHAAIRIAIKGSEDSASSVLGDNNPGEKQLQDGATGAAVYNDASGKESANVIFQVGYLEKDERAKYLSKLSALQNSEAFSKKYKDKTRILLTNAEDDIFNVFNQLIINKKVTQLDDDATRYCLTIGDGFELNRKFKIGIAPRARQNLLMIGNDEKRAASIFYFSILSLLYGELGNADVRKDNQLIHLIDLAVEDEYIEPSNTNFKHIESLFPKQVKRVGMRDMDELIGVTYDTLTRRMDGIEPTDERLFLMFFGINRAHKLVSGNMYEDSENGEMSTLSKLAEIMKHGAKFGINCIVWGENLAATSKVIGANIERDFAQRIVFSTDNATMEQLVMEQNGNALRPTTAVYMNVDDDVKNTHFRPYEIPAKVWVDKIAKTYREFE